MPLERAVAHVLTLGVRGTAGSAFAGTVTVSYRNASGTASSTTATATAGVITVTVPSSITDSVSYTVYLSGTGVEEAWVTVTPETSYTAAKAAFLDASIAGVPAGVWGYVLTGGTAGVQNSAGRRLRELAGKVILSGTAQAGGASTITLAAGASSVDRLYLYQEVSIVGGTGTGQTAMILNYDGTTRVATLHRPWRVVPDATSEYIVTSNTEWEIRNGGLLAGGSANTVVLNTDAVALDGAYVGSTISNISTRETRVITGYVGATRTATVETPWQVTPTAGNIYLVTLHGRTITVRNEDKTGYALQTAPPSAADIAAAVWVAGSRTLTGFGTLVTDVVAGVWGATTRTLTGFGTLVTDVRAGLLTALRLLARKGTPNADDLTALNAGGGTYDPATDALEALRDRGDTAWKTGTGGGTGGGGAVTVSGKTADYTLRSPWSGGAEVTLTVGDVLALPLVLYGTDGAVAEIPDAATVTATIRSQRGRATVSDRAVTVTDAAAGAVSCPLLGSDSEVADTLAIQIIVQTGSGDSLARLAYGPLRATFEPR